MSGDARGETEFVSRSARVVPIGFGELGGEEARHDRFFFLVEDRIDFFQDGSDAPGRLEGDAFLNGGLSGEGENFVDPSPAVQGVFLRDIVDRAWNGGSWDERVAGLEVRFGAVFDVDRREAVCPVADSREGSGAFALKEARDEMAVARAPDEMRAQRDGEKGVFAERIALFDGTRLEARIERAEVFFGEIEAEEVVVVGPGGVVCGADELLGDRFGHLVPPEELRSVGNAFVDPFLRFDRVGDALGAGVDELSHALTETCGDDIASAENIGAIVRRGIHNDAGVSGDVKDDVASADGGFDDFEIVETSETFFDSEFFEERAGMAVEAPRFATFRDQLFEKVLSNKSAAAGD